MKIQKRILTFLLLVFCFQTFGQLKYYEDLAQLRKENEILKKNILVIITGSEWCKPCIKMDNNLLQKKEFYEFANINYSILKIDLPKNMQLSNPIVQNYNNFKRKYKTNALPTLLVLDSSENLKFSINDDLDNFQKTFNRLVQFQQTNKL